MILTYKVKHNSDLSADLTKAKLVADYALSVSSTPKLLSSKYVSHIGLKSAIANQILRKYGKNKECKSVKSVNLIIPNKSIKIINNTLTVIPLKINLDISYLPKFTKVNQVELNKDYAFVSVTISENKPYSPKSIVGLDRNATGHITVAANLSSGKVLKLGKSCLHIRNKYKNIRKSAPRKFIKKLSNKEQKIIKDLNHKISKKIIEFCIQNQSILVLEDLKGIRKQKSKGKKLNGMINSWSFFQLEQFLTYKALMYGVQIVKVNQAYKSQDCSKCGNRGVRDKKKFRCEECKHIDHADSNAAFGIAKKYEKSLIDRDINESITDNAQDIKEK